MVNTEDFIKRMQLIMDHYALSASSLAEKIGVQRSSISHLLSGRNKPSLDFIMKLLSAFEEVDLYWLLNGKGSFPSTTISSPSKSSRKISNSSKDQEKEIDRIIIFFKDGSFKNYTK